MDRQRTPTELAQGIQRNFATLTVESAREYIAQDCVVHEAPSLPFGGDWRGPQGFVDLMAAIQRSFIEFDFIPATMVADDSGLLAFSGLVRGRTPRGHFEMPLVEYWTCRDGKVVDILAMWQDTKLVADLLTPEPAVPVS